jgi:hypothetical protein
MSDLKRALEAEAEVKRLQRVIKRLEAAQGWQPIETAPKNWVSVILAVDDIQGWVVGEAFFNALAQSWTWADGRLLEVPPIKWKPAARRSAAHPMSDHHTAAAWAVPGAR